MTTLPDPARMAPADRAAFAAMLEQFAMDWPTGSAGAANCRVLADLYRHCPTRYPRHEIASSLESGGVGLVVRAASPLSGYGSPGAMCTQGATQ